MLQYKNGGEGGIRTHGTAHVRLPRQSGHARQEALRPLLTQSGNLEQGPNDDMWFEAMSLMPKRTLPRRGDGLDDVHRFQAEHSVLGYQSARQLVDEALSRIFTQVQQLPIFATLIAELTQQIREPILELC
jgi:hypothetical protein